MTDGDLPHDLAQLEARAQALHVASDTSDEAVALNQRILELDSSQRIAYNRLGVALTRRGAFEDALAVFRDALVLEPGNEMAQRRTRELERRLDQRATAESTFVRRPPEEIVEPVLAGPGRAACLRFLAQSIRQIERIDGSRLAVTDIPSRRRFRVVGGIYSAVAVFPPLLCVSVDRALGASIVTEVERADGEVTDRPGPMSAVPRSLELGVPMDQVDQFADALWRPHVEHLKDSIDYGAPTWLHRHDTALRRYLLEEADALS